MGGNSIHLEFHRPAFNNHNPGMTEHNRDTVPGKITISTPFDAQGGRKIKQNFTPTIPLISSRLNKFLEQLESTEPEQLKPSPADAVRVEDSTNTTISTVEAERPAQGMGPPAHDSAAETKENPRPACGRGEVPPKGQCATPLCTPAESTGGRWTESELGVHSPSPKDSELPGTDDANEKSCNTSLRVSDSTSPASWPSSLD